MAAIHIVLFVLTSCCHILCEDIAALDDDKSAFVDILKKDLRRNNDDYVESTTGTLNVTNPYLLLSASPSTPTAETGQFDIVAPGTNKLTNGERSNRRALNSDMDEQNSLSAQENDFNETNAEEYYSPEPTAKTTLRPATRAKHKAKGKSAKMKPNFRSNPKQPAGMRQFGFQQKAVTTTTPFPNLMLNAAQVKQEKLVKFKKFIQKNKELFNEFVNKKRQQSQAKTVARASESNLPFGGEQSLRASNVRAVVPVLNPVQLDMAPAKGGLVHLMRNRNRLCQRNILIPEGPKYNSRGQMYLAEYGHQSGKDFSATDKPKLLLPRCCNCCRKSVLGCE